MPTPTLFFLVSPWASHRAYWTFVKVPDWPHLDRGILAALGGSGVQGRGRPPILCMSPPPLTGKAWLPWVPSTWRPLPGLQAAQGGLCSHFQTYRDQRGAATAADSESKSEPGAPESQNSVLFHAPTSHSTSNSSVNEIVPPTRSAKPRQIELGMATSQYFPASSGHLPNDSRPRVLSSREGDVAAPLHWNGTLPAAND